MLGSGESTLNHMTSQRRAMTSDISQDREIREPREISKQASADFLLKPEWLEASDAYGWRATARNVIPLVALLAIAPALARVNVFAPWLIAPAIGLFLYRITVVMHDCTHHTLFVSRTTNARVGLLLGAVSGVDFHRFCVQHWRHHRLYGRAGDPQGFHYLELAKMTSARLLRHLVAPLFGLKLRNVIGESLLAPGNLARSVRTGEIVVVALVQIVMLAIVTGLGRYPVLAILPFVSGTTFGLFFSQLRGIAEHGQLDAGSGPIVRSHEPRWLDRVLLYDVNFNCHAEHHAHPQVPSCHLPSLQRATGVPATPKSMIATLRDIYAARKASRA
jgi:fatty acid desaturase